MIPETPCQPGEELLNAYLATIYQVNLEDATLNVRIGRTHARLDRMTGATRWTIITACNPGSRQLSERKNRQRHIRLHEIADSAGLRYRPTRHIDPDKHWPTEYGLFIADAEDDWIHALAREFGQFGVVHGHRHAAAELWLYTTLSSRAAHPCVKTLH